ncbi:MAG: hypothetical protein LBL13_04685 [Bacteroidales bacterium]|jgi:hypothetical protein|nr:hypothetical protein [Bacteroidales bacterium]
MEAKGHFYVKDFEAQIWDLIEYENQENMPTIGTRHPKETIQLGDIEVSVNWCVDTMNSENELVSVYSCINYFARINGISGAFGGTLETKSATYRVEF